MKPSLIFHANFKKVSGPLVSGETQIVFDVPELFENEIEGIVRVTKNKNLIIALYDADNDYVEESNPSITEEENIS